MAISGNKPPRSYSRRHFLRQLLGAGALTTAGLDSLLAQTATPPAASPQPFRFVFFTDPHLMDGGALRSADGMATCLDAIEKITPRPEFILVGGDLVHDGRHCTISEGEQRLDIFLKLWNDHTSLPVRWVFGNHDLIGTSNPGVDPRDKHYSKGLFQDRFQLPHLFYSFDHKGWHFVVLDDIDLLPDRNYQGRLFDDELQFLKADLDAHRTTPTILCVHIPIVSPLALAIAVKTAGTTGHFETKSLICTNAGTLFDDLPGHNIRAVLSGHLHHLERIDHNGISIINSGAVCGHYWQGPMLGCPEGFGVVDLGADGTVAFDYRSYGWKA